MSTDPPNPPWGPPPGGGYPPPPPPDSYPGGGYPPAPPPPGYPGGSRPGPYPGGNDFEDPTQTPFGQLAGWWLRVGATLIDTLIVGVPLAVIVGVAGLSWRDIGWMIQLVNLAYVVLMIGSPAGQTLGMKAVGTRAVDVANGQPIGYTRALVRTLVTALFGAISLVFSPGGLLGLADDLWPLWDQRNQTLHDKVAKSIVVIVR